MHYDVVNYDTTCIKCTKRCGLVKLVDLVLSEVFRRTW